jgi:hypothetical protein
METPTDTARAVALLNEAQLAHDLVEGTVDDDDPRIETLERYVGTYTNHLSGEVYPVHSRDGLEFIRFAFPWGSQAETAQDAAREITVGLDSDVIHFAITYARRVVDNVIDHVTEPDPNQYLAWGGEAEGYTIVTVDRIRKDLAQESASGVRMWTRFALIGPRAQRSAALAGLDAAARGMPVDWPETWPVELRNVGRSSHDDYVTEAFIIVTPYGEVKDEFTATHDGRV